jgi:hypothetical protein
MNAEKSGGVEKRKSLYVAFFMAALRHGSPHGKGRIKTW